MGDEKVAERPLREDLSDELPEAKIDPEPDPGNEAGGVDAADEIVPFPPVTPDEPLSAQVDEDVVPDAIQEPEEPDSEANVDDPSTEPSA